MNETMENKLEKDVILFKNLGNDLEKQVFLKQKEKEIAEMTAEERISHKNAIFERVLAIREKLMLVEA